MQQPHGGLDFVLVLPARPAGAKALLLAFLQHPLGIAAHGHEGTSIPL
jgi:hypothetical protein